VLNKPLGPEDLSAFVLAGGKSQRFGSNKALIPIGGQPLLRMLYERLMSRIPYVRVIGPYQPAAGLPRRVYWPDILPGLGPIGGVYTALQWSPSCINFIISCDLPFFDPRLIDWLLSEYRGEDVLGFRSDGGEETLCTLYSKATLPWIERQIGEGNYKLRGFYPKVRTRFIPAQELPFYQPRLFFNLNTPKDLQLAMVQWSEGPVSLNFRNF